MTCPLSYPQVQKWPYDTDFLNWNIVDLQCCINYCCTIKWFSYTYISSVQFICSVMSDSLWPQEPQHARPPCPSPTAGVYQTPVCWVGDAIQPSHPLSSPSPPALNLSQHQGLFKYVSSSHQVAKVCIYIFFSIMVYHSILNLVLCAV